jgi:two-component SAPR family response regulator
MVKDARIDFDQKSQKRERYQKEIMDRKKFNWMMGKRNYMEDLYTVIITNETELLRNPPNVIVISLTP